MLPFKRFRTVEGRGVDHMLGPEMRSTGEVMGIDANFGTAFAKSQSAAYGGLPTKGTVFVSVANRDKRAMIFPVKRLADLGFEVLATDGTADVLRRNGVEATVVRKHSHGRGPDGEPTIVERILAGEVDMVVNTPSGPRRARRRLRDPGRRDRDGPPDHHDRAAARGRRAGHRGARPRRARRPVDPGLDRRACDVRGGGARDGGGSERTDRPCRSRGEVLSSRRVGAYHHLTLVAPGIAEHDPARPVRRAGRRRPGHRG